MVVRTYIVTMKTGQEVIVETEKNLIGLWVWATRQITPQVLTIGNVAILSTEIATIIAEGDE